MFNASTKQRQHIESLKVRKNTQDDNARTLTETLHRDIANDFSGNNKYLFELLQNADDASNGATVHVEFKMVDDYLILTHNGIPFDDQHTEKLCNYVQREGGKTTQADKIGYKGIGFKSIFTISDRVQIISGGYSFRFDKEAFKNSQGQIHSPWPIIPLWTGAEDTPACARSYLQGSTKTYFILKIKNKALVQRDLTYIKNNPQMILFLRHIPAITIINEQSEEKIVLKNEANDVKSLIYNNNLSSRWLVHSFTIEIPESVKASLQEMDEYTCPARLKTAAPVTMSFAASLNIHHGRPQARNPSQLYCYLPTQVYLTFPTLINTDFLLNSQRSELLANNAWNNFLLEEISFHLLRWIAQLARNPVYKKYILNFFPPQIISTIPSIQEYYKTGYTQAIKEIACLPTMLPQGNALLTLDQAWVDETGFFKQFSAELAGNEIFNMNALIDDELENLTLIKNLVGQRIVNLHYLLTLLPGLLNKGHFFAPQRYQALLRFLDTLGAADTWASIKLIPALFSQGYHAIKDTNLFILDDNIKEPPIRIAIDFVHPSVYQGSSEIRTLLIKWGMKVLKIEDVLTKICDLIEQNKADINAYDDILLYLFDHRKYLSDTHYKQLQKFPVRTQQNTFAPPFFLYLSASYDGMPETQWMGPEKLIHPGYLTHHNDSGAWGDFFKKLGAKQQVDFRKINTLPIHTLPHLFITVEVQNNIGQSYLNYLQEKYKAAIEKDGYTVLSHLSLIDLMEILLLPGSPAFANYLNNFFYPKILAHSHEVNEPTYLQHPEHPGRRIPIDETFLQFFISRYPFVIDTNNQLNVIKNLYFIPNEAWLFGNLLPMPQNPPEMTTTQAKQLGYKTEVELEIYLQLLHRYGHEFHNDTVSEAHMDEFIQKYHEILMKVLGFNKKNRNIKEKITAFCSQNPLKLLSQNNRLTLTGLLYRFAIKDILLDTSGQSNAWIKQLDLFTQDDFITLCDLFSIQPVTSQDIELVHENANYNDTAKLFLFNRLYYIALAQSKETNQRTETLFTEYKDKLSTLNFAASDKLTLVHKTSKVALQQTFACYDVNKKIIFFKRQVNPLTINALSLILKNILNLHDNAQKVTVMALGITNDDILALELADLGYTLNSASAYPMPPSSNTHTGYTATTSGSSYFPSNTDVNQNSMPTLPKPSEVRFDTIKIDSIKASQRNQISSANASVQTLIQDLQLETTTLVETGRWGEELIYLYLLWHYATDKYTALPNTFQETPQGFLIQSTRKKDQAPFQITVLWHNKINESGSHRDLTIHKKHLNANNPPKEKIIEVKATKSPGKSTLYLSSHEVEEMKKPHYKLYRVTAAHTLHPTITKVKNLNEEIKNGYFPVGYLMKL